MIASQPFHDPDAVIGLATHWASRLDGVTTSLDGADGDMIASVAIDILGRADIGDLDPEIAFHRGAQAVSRMILAAMNDPFGDPREAMLEILTGMRPDVARWAADERKYQQKRSA